MASEKKMTVKQQTAVIEAAGLRELLEQIYNDGRESGFRDGVRYIVTLAERKARKKPADMPAWWTATLLEGLLYEPAPKRLLEEKGEEAKQRISQKED